MTGVQTCALPICDYILTPQVILKKGLYTFYFDVVTESIGNGYFVIDSNDEIILMDEFLPGVKEEVVQLEILDTSKQVRIGVSYDPAGGTFLFKKVYIESDFIISRDSILRHFCCIFVLSDSVYAAGLAYFLFRLLVRSIRKVILSRERKNIDLPCGDIRDYDLSIFLQ